MYTKSMLLQHDHRIGVIAGILATVGWSGTGIFVYLLSNVSPIVVICGRFTIASVMGAVLLILHPKTLRGLYTATSSATSWALSLFLVAYYFLSVFAFQYAPVSTVSLLISTSPAFIVVIDGLSKQVLSNIQKTAAGFAFFGIIVVVIPSTPDFQNTSSNYVGATLALGGACVMALYALLYRHLSIRKLAPSPLVIGVQTAVSGALLSALLLLHQASELRITALTIKDLNLLIGLGLVSTVIPSISYGVAAVRLAPIVLTTIRSSTPIGAAILAFIILDESPRIEFYFGASFILSAMLLQTIDGMRAVGSSQT